MIRKPLESGFTLLEALVAMAIISIASSALIAAASNATRITAQRFSVLDATISAQQRLTNLVAETPDDELEDGRWRSETTLIATQSNGDGRRLYRISVDRSPTAEEGAPPAKLVTYVIR